MTPTFVLVWTTPTVGTGAVLSADWLNSAFKQKTNTSAPVLRSTGHTADRVDALPLGDRKQQARRASRLPRALRVFPAMRAETRGG
jgi:hypothetical protein